MEFETTNEQLALRVQAGADVAENMLQLWEQCRGFIATIARKYQGRGEMEDLMQEGYLALSEAVDGYDPEQGMSFVNYAAFYIKRRMALCCQKSACVRLPLGIQGRVWKYRRLVSDFNQEYGREPYDRELCALMRISRSQLKEIRKVAGAEQADSLDRPLDMDNGFSVEDTLPDTADVEGGVLDEVQREELAAALWPMVDSLETEQADIIRAKYQDGLGWDEIAARCGLSRAQAAAREKKGLYTLRTSKGSGVLRSFLDEYISVNAYHGNGAQAFNRTWTSSTERVALKLAEMGRGTATPRNEADP